MTDARDPEIALLAPTTDRERRHDDGQRRNLYLHGPNGEVFARGD